MAKKVLLNRYRRWFRYVLTYRLRYYLRSIAYANPALLRLVKRIIDYKSPNPSPAFWDAELAGPKAFYLENILPIEARRTLIATLARHTIPDAQSVLDVGCAGGLLALTLAGNGINRYAGVDISEYAIKMAREKLLKHKKMCDTRFYVSNLCVFTPENSDAFDIIVFNEVLYYLDTEEVITQLVRYSNWLRPNGALCISMKDDPKSCAIYRAISTQFQLVHSILFQVNPYRVEYQIIRDEKFCRFAISIFRPIEEQ